MFILPSGGDWATTEWFFDNLEAEGVPFDIIGESYYPFYQGSLTALGTCLSQRSQYFWQTHHGRRDRVSLDQHLPHRLVK